MESTQTKHLSELRVYGLGKARFDFHLPGLKLRGSFINDELRYDLVGGLRILWRSPCCEAVMSWSRDRTHSTCQECNRNFGSLYPFADQHDDLLARLEAVVVKRAGDLSLGLDPLQEELVASEILQALREAVITEYGAWPGERSHG